MNSIMNKKYRILLVNPPYSHKTYKEIIRKAGTLQNPVLSLPTIAAPLMEDGHEVKLIDLDIENNPYAQLTDKLKDFDPHYVGVTGTTPMAEQMNHISTIAKRICPESITIAGGVHATTLPNEILESTNFDIAVIGEGDFTLRDIIRKYKLAEIPGIAFKIEGLIRITQARNPIKDLDDIPVPKWELYDIQRYKSSSKLVEQKSPVGLIETSRGCFAQCIYCNKNIFGRKFRHKSPKRVVDEMMHMLDLGFNELHIEDDGFSTNLKNAKAICEEIIERNLIFPWTLINGCRVDRFDDDLANKLKKAGCYQIAFGIESGNQIILDRIQKGTNKEQAMNAIRIAKRAGLETFAFFMLGLPGETKETMQESIDFAIKLDPDIVKFSISVPLPGTQMYDEYEKQGLIKSKLWADYLFHNTSEPVFNHPNLEWGEIIEFYKKAYRSFYFRPKYIIKRIYKSLQLGRFAQEMSYVVKTKWW